MRVVIVLIGLLLSFPSWAGEPLRVTFLSPADEKDAFFGPLINMMRDAAKDLSMDLEVVDASRNHLELRRRGDEILNRKVLPDYLLVINERDVLVNMMKRADKLGVKVFLFNEGLSPEGYLELGEPREKLKNWLGELIPNDRQSGYLLAKSLIAQADEKGLRDDEGILHLVGLNGAHKTNSAALRLLGLQDAIGESQKVKLHQVIYANWEEEKAYIAAKGMLRRYAKTGVIWSASDLMAYGAMRAVRETGKKPGEDIILGGVDWADLAFDHVRKGNFSATAGGHFLDGAWAMVMLYDYHNENDFILRQKSDFSVITQDNIHLFDRYLRTADDRNKIDFKAFSKTHRTYNAPYDFSLEAVFKHLAN